MTSASDQTVAAKGGPAREGTTLAILAITLAIVMWGAAPVANRFLVGVGNQQITPGALLALRFGLAALLLFPLAWHARPHRWDRHDQIMALLAALCGVIGYNLPVTLGQTTIPAGTAALVLATEPVWILILWALSKRQAPTWGAILGAVIGLIGIAVLETGNLELIGTASLSGIGFVLLAAFFWSAYCVLAAGLIRRKGALAVTSTTMAIGCIPFLAAHGLDVPQAVRGLNTAGLAAVCVLAIGSTVIATLLWNYGVATLPGPRSGSFLYGVPVIGVLAGHVVLDEPLSLRVILAAILVISGVVIAQAHERRRTRRLST